MPGRIDQSRPFLPVNIAILTVSDTRDASQDRSGDTLADLVTPGTGSQPERSCATRAQRRSRIESAISRDPDSLRHSGCEQELIVAQLKECIVDPTSMS